MRKRIVLRAVIIVVFCPVAVFGQNVYQEEAKRHLDRGVALMETAKSPADYEAAIEEFKQAAKLWPHSPEIFFNLACAQEKTGEYGAAEENLRIYLLSAPDARGTEKVKSLISRLKKKYGYGGFNPLLDAAKKNQVEIAGRLIAQGADVNARDRSGWTPLDEAVLWGQKEVAALLIANGADVNNRRGNGKAPLHHVVLGVLTDKVGGKRLTEVVKLLIANGADINAKDEYGWTPLHDAVNTLDVEFSLEMVELLIAKGADIHTRNRSGYTPLHAAAFQGHKDAVGLLIDRGAEVNAKDERGETPLHHAAFMGRKEVADLLIAKGARINVWNENGQTPLQLAEAKNNKSVGEMIKERSGLLTRLEASLHMDRSLITSLFVINFALMLLALVGILRIGFKRHHKFIWILVILLVPFLGSLCYVLIGRKHKMRGGKPGHPPASANEG